MFWKVPATALAIALTFLTGEAVIPDLEVQPVASHVSDADGVVSDDSGSAPDRTVWDDLADCETGNWLPGPTFETGSARWHTGATAEHLTDERSEWSNVLFYGGVQVNLDSWDWARDVGGHSGLPDNPGNATRAQQIAVAETLLAIHPAGWGAWPTCSAHLGLR